MTDGIRPHQIEAASWLASKETALLCDAPRVGKTLSAIRGADLIGARSVVVVCPAHLRENWRREIARWREGNWGAYITGYSRVKDFNVRFRDQETDVLVLDEAHFLKTRDSQRSIAVWGKNSDRVGGLAGRAKRIWLLTGTPMTASPLDLWPALRACAPEIIARPLTDRPLSFSGFREKYCAQIQTPFGMKIIGSKNAKELRLKLAPWVMRRTRGEVYGSDVQHPTMHYCEVKGAQARELGALEQTPNGKAIRAALDKGDMRALARLAEHASAYRKLVGMAKVSAVSEYVGARLDEEPGSKIVIAAWHTDVVNAYRDSLKGYGVVVLDGSVAVDRKQPIVDRFQHDPKVRVFVGQIVAAGTGITLDKADEVVFGELSWTFSDNAQMGARSYAPGKQNPCLQTYAVVAGSIDDEIARVSARRATDATKILGG